MTLIWYSVHALKNKVLLKTCFWICCIETEMHIKWSSSCYLYKCKANNNSSVTLLTSKYFVAYMMQKYKLLLLWQISSCHGNWLSYSFSITREAVYISKAIVSHVNIFRMWICSEPQWKPKSGFESSINFRHHERNKW